MCYVSELRRPHSFVGLKLFRPVIAACVVLYAVSVVAQCSPQPPAATQTPTPTQKASETPKTAPQVKKVLPSYEGQNVSAVEIAGRPDVKTEDYESLFVQKAGEPFTRTKIDETIAAIKRTG